MSTASIQLNDGRVALIDQADLAVVSRFCWYASADVRGRFSVRAHQPNTRRNSPKVILHRLLLDVTNPTIRVDHKNGDPFDNRRDNLRTATASQNAMNVPKKSSKFLSDYKGVTRRGKKFRAVITKDRKNIYLGTFPTQELAAAVYDSAALKLHGSFARLNFGGVQ